MTDWNHELDLLSRYMDYWIDARINSGKKPVCYLVDPSVVVMQHDLTAKEIINLAMETGIIIFREQRAIITIPLTFELWRQNRFPRKVTD